MYGGKSDYRNNVMYGREGLFTRLGNTILKELKEYDRSLSEQQMKGKRAVMTGGDESAKAQRKILRRGLILLEYDLKCIYSKVREEIARRGDDGTGSLI